MLPFMKEIYGYINNAMLAGVQCAVWDDDDDDEASAILKTISVVS